MGPFCILVRGDLDEDPRSTHAAAKLPVRSRAARQPKSAKREDRRRSRPQGEAQGWAESIPLPPNQPDLPLIGNSCCRLILSGLAK